MTATGGNSCKICTCCQSQECYRFSMESLSKSSRRRSSSSMRCCCSSTRILERMALQASIMEFAVFVSISPLTSMFAIFASDFRTSTGVDSLSRFLLTSSPPAIIRKQDGTSDRHPLPFSHRVETSVCFPHDRLMVWLLPVITRAIVDNDTGRIAAPRRPGQYINALHQVLQPFHRLHPLPACS